MAGETYVIYGGPSLPATIDLNSTSAGLTVYGDDWGDWSGRFVAAGDIDGDTTDDLIIGAYWARPAGRFEAAGETYVIYGSDSLPATIDLDSTSAGLTVYGDDEGDESGYPVAAGDIDGDTTDDLIIGAYNASPAGGSRAGETYVIYGGPQPTPTPTPTPCPPEGCPTPTDTPTPTETPTPTITPTPTVTPTPTITPTPTPIATPTPCPPEGCPTATPKSASAVGMVLNAHGPVGCDHPTRPARCTVTTGMPFVLSVATKGIPAGGYSGFQTQIVYAPLVYKPTAFADMEIVWPDAGAGVLGRDPEPPSGHEGKVYDWAMTSWFSPFPVSSFEGNIVEITLNCSVDAQWFKIALTTYSAADNPLGSVFVDADGSSYVNVKAVGEEQIDLDGDTTLETLAVADTLYINCDPSFVAPTATPKPPGPKLSLDAKTGACAAVVKESSCDVVIGTTATVSVILSELDLPDLDEDTKAGYDGFQVRLTYPSGLSLKNRTDVTEVVWPDCYTATAAQLKEAGSYTAGCGILPAENESTYLGSIVEVDFNCTQPGAFRVELVPGTPLDSFLVDEEGSPVLPSKGDSIWINCLQPTPTPTPDPALDSDGDGCSDAEEAGDNPVLGGRRNYLYFWDFYDVWTRPLGDPEGWERNGVINILDILAVAGVSARGRLSPKSRRWPRR